MSRSVFGTVGTRTSGPRRVVVARSAILALSMVASLLTSCSGSEEPPTNDPGNPCAQNPLSIEEMEQTFTPTVEYYSVRDDGLTLVLYAEVDVIDNQYSTLWTEEYDRVFVVLYLYGSEPTGPDFLLQEVEIDLERPLGNRIVCYGDTELVESFG